MEYLRRTRVDHTPLHDGIERQGVCADGAAFSDLRAHPCEGAQAKSPGAASACNWRYSWLTSYHTIVNTYFSKVQLAKVDMHFPRASLSKYDLHDHGTAYLK